MATVKIPETLYRTATFERSSVDPDNRTVRMSVSSDAPIKRSFGTEILDHSVGAVRMDRIQNGAPLLFNHDPDMHLGRILEATNDGHKMHIVAKFSRSKFAEEKWQDVQDGILADVSIGYAVNKMNEESRGVFRATDWEPFETSFCPLAADISIGLGRTKDLEVTGVQVDNPTNTKSNPPLNMAEPVITPPAPTIDVVAERKQGFAEGFKAYQDSCRKIEEFVAAIKNEGWRTHAHKVSQKFKAQEKPDFDGFRSEYLNTLDEAKPIETPNPKLDMSRKERARFSFTRLFSSLKAGKTDIFEVEACQAAREHLRKLGDETVASREGFTIPEDVLEANMAEDNELDSRAISRLGEQVRQLQMRTGLNASTQNVGGYLIGTDLLAGSLIELLRNKALLSTMGITNLEGLVNNIAIPRVLTGSTVYWLGEAVSVTASNETFGQLTMTPHRMGADVYFTKQLVAQASLSVEALVRDDMTRQMAVELDRAWINGSGLAGEPTGILNTAGIGTESWGGIATWANVLAYEKTIAAANADQLGEPVWLTTPGVRNKWKQIPKVGTTFPVFIWEGGNNPGMVNGYSAYVTNNVPGNKTLFFIPKEFIAARWAGIDIVVDPYSLKKTEQIEITTHQYVDCGVRHPVAFDVSTDSGAS